MIVYKIQNIINNKIYIGQTISTLKHRLGQHYSKSSHCYALHKAIKKYGKENFTIDVIDTASTLEELNNKEIYWIEKLNTISPNGYNLVSGGKNKICSDETKKKMSIAQKNKSDETRKKLSESAKKRVYSDEYRKQMSITSKLSMTDERRKKISESLKKYYNNKPKKEKIVKERKSRRMTDEQRLFSLSLRKGKPSWNKGKTLSEEHKRKLSLAHKGKKLTDEAKEKCRQANLGRPKSKETRLKISLIHKGKKMSKESIEKGKETRKRNNELKLFNKMDDQNQL